VFDDGRQYWFPEIPTVGVKVPDAGVRMRVVSVEGTTLTVRITDT
jgi:immune inhibitor A